MRNHIIFKFIAVTLCAAALLGIVFCGSCFLVLGYAGLLGSKSPAQLKLEKTASLQEKVALEAASQWMSHAYGGVPEAITDAISRDWLEMLYQPNSVYLTIENPEGKTLYTNLTDQTIETNWVFTFPSVTYQQLVPTNDKPSEGTPAFASAEAADENVYTHGFWDEQTGQWYEYSYTDAKGPGCTVTLHLTPNAVLDDPSWDMLISMWIRRADLLKLLIAFVLVFAVFAVYLCCAAGRTPASETIKAGGLNAMPLDLYAGLVLFYLAGAITLVDEFGKEILKQSVASAAWCAGGLGFGGCLLFVGFCFAFAAQIKTAGHFWWWNSLCGRGLKLSWWLLRKAYAALRWFLPRLCNTICQAAIALYTVAAWLLALTGKMLSRIGKNTGLLFRHIGRTAEHFFSLLPLTWQWMLGGIAMILILVLFLAGGDLRMAVLGIAICLAMVLYGAGSFATLLEAAQNMRSGELETKVDDRYLVGSFRSFAEELNGLAGVAMVAAQKQLKSEHMKTELITNVSHDIKTPLTSIINYVDLLAKPHTQAEEKEYLEVLARQSGRMKKLIDDLMEMSKASSGNIPVEIITLDAAETVNQALGEFADKLEAAGLTPVFRAPEEPVFLQADGRLVWRAMSNILSNAVKYALPGTRLYIDVAQADGKAVISFKNISRAELNVSADELLERFVRGDTSRNTEGSGLGLNIAQSLMELQKGKLQLLVDGDLFKVTLIFPQ